MIIVFTFLSFSDISAEDKDTETINSLYRELNSSKEDTFKVNVLLNLSGKIFTSEPKKAILFAHQALSLSEKLKWDKGISEAFNNLGNTYSDLSNFQEADKCYQSSLEINQKIGNKLGTIHNYGNLAYLRIYQGKFEQALEFSFKSLKLAEEIHYEKSQVKALVTIGRIYNELGNNEQSIKYYQSAFNLSILIQDEYTAASAANNLGIVFFEEGNNQKSIDEFNKSLTLNLKNNNLLFIGQNFQNLSEVYLKLNETQKSLDYIEKAIAINLREGFRTNLLNNQIFKGKILIKLGRFDEGMNEMKEGLKISEASNENEITLDTYKQLSEIYLEHKDYENAYKYLDKFNKLKETNFNKQLNNKIYELENAKIESESNQKNLKNDIESKYKYLFEAFTLGFLIFIFFLIFYSFSKSKKAKKLEQDFKELFQLNQAYKIQKDEIVELRNKYLSIINHDVKIPLIEILSFLEINEGIPNDNNSEQEDISKSILISLRTVITLLTNLHTWSKNQLGLMIPQITKIEISHIINKCIGDFSNIFDSRVVINKIPNNTILMIDELLFELIIRNILSNAFRFSIPNSRIEIYSDSSNISQYIYTLVVEDSGIGLSEDQIAKLFKIDHKFATQGLDGEIGSGMGLIISKDLIEKMGGSIEVESVENLGTKIFLRFKV